MSHCFRTLLVAGLLVSSCGPDFGPSQLKESYEGKNHPHSFHLQIQRYEDLPTSGFISDAGYPWGDDYWATYGGGISRRWQNGVSSQNYRDHLYDFLSQQSVFSGTVDISKLSPAEKYDLWMGRYDFPLAKHERQLMLRSVQPSTDSIPGWFGLCHGWAAASLLEAEPGAMATVQNRDGLTISFNSSDIKALLTKIYSDYSQDSSFVGERCEQESHQISTDAMGRVVSPACRDLNPGTLHLALGQMLGAGKGFILDITLTAQVWNQPVTGFRVKNQSITSFNPQTDPMAQYRATGTTSLVHVQTEIFYAQEISPQPTPVKVYKDSYTQALEVEYVLELDAQGRIIGGEWISQQHPDFMWKVNRLPQTGNGYLNYSYVKQLSDLSRQ